MKNEKKKKLKPKTHKKSIEMVHIPIEYNKWEIHLNAYW